MTEEKLAEIKSHVQQWDRTCLDVRRAFEDRDTLIVEAERMRTALDRIAFCGAGEDYRVLREIARKALTP